MRSLKVVGPENLSQPYTGGLATVPSRRPPPIMVMEATDLVPRDQLAMLGMAGGGTDSPSSAIRRAKTVEVGHVLYE